MQNKYNYLKFTPGTYAPTSPLRESHVWIEFVVGFLLCSEVFVVIVVVFGPLVFLASQVTAIRKMLVTTFL